MKLKTSMLKSSFCDYSDAYILVKGKITITGAGDDATAWQVDESDNGVALKIVLYSQVALVRLIMPK